MGKRRGRRTRSDEGGRRADIDGGFDLGPFYRRWSPLSPAGKLEELEHFGPGWRSARLTRRRPLLAVVVLPFAVIAVGLPVMLLVHYLF